MGWIKSEGFTVLDFILEGTSAIVSGNTIVLNADEEKRVHRSLCNNKLERFYKIVTR